MAAMAQQKKKKKYTSLVAENVVIRLLKSQQNHNFGLCSLDCRFQKKKKPKDCSHGKELGT